MRVPLACGAFALVDADDAERVATRSWWRVGNYVTGKERQRHIKLHRWLLGVTDPNVFVDHIDRDPLNNQRANLRTCNRLESMWNTGSHKDSQTGIKGVYPHGDRYYAGAIWFCGRREQRLFKTIEAAAEWVRARRIELQGEFAALEDRSSLEANA